MKQTAEDIRLETESERLTRLEREKMQADADRYNAERDAQNRVSLLAGVEAERKLDAQRRASEERDKTVIEHRQRAEQLLAAKNRVEQLKSAIEHRRELVLIEVELADCRRRLDGPLQDVSQATTARIHHLEAVKALWPARLEFLKAQKVEAEADVAGLQTAMEKLLSTFKKLVG